MTTNDFIPNPYEIGEDNGQITWASPSNIALVKYWGKKEHQIPANPSVSFTLDTCRTTTTLKYTQKEATHEWDFDVFLDGEKKDDFKPKIATFFKRIEAYLPFLKHYYFEIQTSNSFPHSSGIASSASGMSALALCLMSLEKRLMMADSQIEDAVKATYKANFMKKASFLARLGSGSACRSLEGDLIVWGAHKDVTGSSDLFGTPYPYQVHDIFKKYNDTILLVDKGEKQVSSTVGHNLMHGHPFAEQRFAQAHDNLSSLINVFKEGDLKAFISIVEREALTLHAMMMSSDPYFILMRPNTLEIIQKIWKFREATGLHVCFTLDAGANVHVLYPDTEATEVYEFIKSELVAYCQNGHYICDTTGFGATQLNAELSTQ